MSDDTKWLLPELHQDFEVMCLHIAQEKYQAPDAQLFGRNGQEQGGIDIKATTPDDVKVVIQCKFKGSHSRYTSATLIDELNDDFEKAIAAHEFDTFVFASNTPTDAKLQKHAEALRNKHAVKVVIWSLDHIKAIILKYETLRELYKPDPNATNPIPRTLNTPPVQPQAFFGRTEELKTIEQTLTSPQKQLLILVNGEGGIGKTPLAARYYHEYGPKYQHLAWIYAESGIANSLLTLEIPLQLGQKRKNYHQTYAWPH